MDSFWKVITQRRSHRAYKPDPIPNNLIIKCLKAAHLAPSAGNQKNWLFICITNKEKLELLQSTVKKKIETLRTAIKSPRAKKEYDAYSWKYFTFFAEAPVLICVIMKQYDSLTARILQRALPEGTYTSTAGIQSVAAATENLLLALTHEGLGSCWMTGPLIARTELEEQLDIKSPDTLFALIPAGYTKEKKEPHLLTDAVHEYTTWIE